jgi:hypothetical protein
MNIKKLFNITIKALTVITVLIWNALIGIVLFTIKVLNYVGKFNNGSDPLYSENGNSSNDFSDEINKQATYQNGVSGNMRSGNVVYK